MNLFSFLYKTLMSVVRPIGCLIALIVIIVFGSISALFQKCSNSITDGQMETYREYIEKGEYAEARKYAINNKLDISEVITQQAYELMIQGEISNAKNLCAHENQMNAYFEALVTNIQEIYEAQGLNAVSMAFAMIPYPSPNEYSLSDDFKAQWGLQGYQSTSTIINKNNRAIESLCTYIVAQNKNEDLSIILQYLQPLPDTKKPNYDEVNRIKKKFK